MPEVLGNTRLVLGEGPVWDKDSNHLYCVDIQRHEILRFNVSTGSCSSWAFGKLPAALGLCRSGRLIIGSQDGVFLAEFGSDDAELLCNPVAHRRKARLNDGKVAPDGSFWVGSMQNNIAGDGSAIEIVSNIGGFFQVRSDGSCVRVIDERLGIANTLAWAPDNTHFIYADSLANTLYRVGCREDLCGPATVFNDNFDRGVPDGSAIDVEGYLWNCRWGGNCVVRFTPDARWTALSNCPRPISPAVPLAVNKAKPCTSRPHAQD